MAKQAKGRRSVQEARPVESTSRSGGAAPITLWMAAAALTLACVLIYAQTGSHDFVNYDDPNYVVQNANVNRGWTLTGVKWAFTSVVYYYWHPLTWLSIMADCQLFGLRAGPMHLVSAALHAINAALLLAALWMLTGSVWRSAFAAGLFALHPLRVESVAWVAERKDVLSGLFWMLTIIAYAHYAKSPSLRRYAWVFAAFFAAVLSKPTVVTLPFVLLLLDWWPLGRWKSIAEFGAMVKEKVPLFVLIVIVSGLTYTGQSLGGATVSLSALPLSYRLPNAALSYLRYLGKLVWPTNLGVLYPLGKLSGAEVTGALLLLAGVTVVALIRARKNGYLLTGWLWFLGAMVPMIGLAQSGLQALADRFTYLPMIGLAIAIAWGAGELFTRYRVPLPVRAAAGGLLLGVLTFISIVQTSYWKDSFSLFEHTIAVTKDNDIMHINLGGRYEQRGELDKATEHYEAALKIEPRNVEVHYSAATAYFKKRDAANAIRHFDAALNLQPEHPLARKGKAECLISLGRREEARAELKMILQRYPGDVEARASLLMLGQ